MQVVIAKYEACGGCSSMQQCCSAADMHHVSVVVTTLGGLTRHQALVATHCRQYK